MQRYFVLFMFFALTLSGCATATPKAKPVESSVSKDMQIEAQKKIALPPLKTYKRKVIIGRFTNETNYGKALMTDDQFDRIGKQASDMLANRLIKSQRFIVLERTDITKLKDEQEFVGDVSFVGTDVIILGSVTEFGRSISGKSGFLSSAKRQTARAKVEIRLVDAKTGHAFFSGSGVGEASTESSDKAGFGNHSAYDGTLNDQAIGAAISDVLSSVINKLEGRSWKTDILDIQGDQIFISGGESQGLKIDNQLLIMKRNKSIKSKQSGFSIDLPPEEIATVQVVSFFGDDELSEGSVCKIIEGNVVAAQKDLLFVKEGNKNE